MKRIMFSVVFMVLVFTSSGAFAGNAYDWTGFYLGVQGMHAGADTKWEYENTGGRFDHTTNGWMGGFFLGYNYQFPFNAVVGVETDINYGKFAGSYNDNPTAFSYNSELNWLGSTRIRAGYAVWRFLPYVGAGLAYGRANIYTKNAAGTEFGETNNYIGWTSSIGLEFAITKNLMARAEYSYYDLGKKSSLVESALPVKSTLTIDEGFKIGLLWKFGGAKEQPQPVARVVEPEPLPPPPPPVEEVKKVAEVEQTIIEKGRVTMNVEFDTGKAVVKPAYYKEIEPVTNVMKKQPDLKIVVEGHTDNVGGKKYNQNLSQKRADAIKEVMVSNFNIDSSRITAKGFGFANPIGDNKTKAGKQINRRVEAAVDYEYTVKKK